MTRYSNLTSIFAIVFTLLSTMWCSSTAYSLGTHSPLPPSIEAKREYEQGLKSLQEKQPYNAVKFFRRVGSLNSGVPEAFGYYYALSLYQTGDFAQAKNVLSDWLQKKTKSVMPEYSLALSLMTKTLKKLPANSTPQSKFAYSGSGNRKNPWVHDLRELYLASDDKSALLHHLNTLLTAHPPRPFLESMVIRGSRVLGEKAMSSRIRVEPKGIVSLNVDKQYLNNTLQSKKTTPVVLDPFGINPNLNSFCTSTLCYFANPKTGEPFIFFDLESDIKDELSRTLTELIRLVQME